MAALPIKHVTSVITMIIDTPFTDIALCRFATAVAPIAHVVTIIAEATTEAKATTEAAANTAIALAEVIKTMATVIQIDAGIAIAASLSASRKTPFLTTPISKYRPYKRFGIFLYPIKRPQ